MITAMRVSVLLLLLTSPLMAAPVNDNFSARLSLGSAAGVSASGNNTAATLQVDENDLDSIGGASVWWKWTAPATAWVSVDTSGSAIDTVLAVLTDGPALDDAFVVGFNDESGDSTAPQGSSRVVFAATAGTEYHIAVHGFLAAQGDIALNIQSGITPPLRITSLTVTPASVNVTTASQTITADIGVAGEAAFAEGSIFLHRANFSGITELPFLPANRISGTAGSGIYRVSIPISRYSEPGTWMLEAAVSDSSGREAVFGRGVSAAFEYDHVLPDGLPGLLPVTNSGSIDQSTPVLTSFSISPGAANVTANPANLIFGFAITDNLSGFGTAILTLYAPSGQALTALPVTAAHRLAGTVLSGSYSVTFSLPAKMPGGTWRATLLIRDATGNPALYDGGENGLNFPLGAPSGEMTITGSPNSYQAWIYPRSASAPGNRPGDDLDGDGISNLLEYAFGLAPDENDSGAPDLIPGMAAPGMPVYQTTPAGLSIHYSRRTGESFSGLTYTAEFTGNFTSWTGITGGSTVPLDDQFEQVSVSDSFPGGGRRFGRVKVTMAE